MPRIISRSIKRALGNRPETKARYDIQGLRAVAVLAVIADHLLHWPTGGFVGVDVFFVISGFLITGLLVREYERSGSISFANFYRRRIRRIIPASLLVLAVTVGSAFALFSNGRAWATAWDAVWAALFSANWRFAATGTDYFQATAPPSPLQHFWSLSVEEQFYFVWPWLMLGVLYLAIGRTGRASNGHHTRVVAGSLMGVVIVASLAWSIYETATGPTVAYFSTVTRAWELGVGALLAIIAPVLGRIPVGARPALAWLGLAGIAASVFLVTSDLPFPGPWALAPVLATAVVIAAGSGISQQRFVWPLTNRVTTYIGDISYSLYLWHFPVIIFAAVLLPAGTATYFAACAAGIIFLSVASYHLVEVPLHHSPLLDRFPSPRARTAAYAKWRGTYAARYKYGSVAVLAAITVPVVFSALAPPDTDAVSASSGPRPVATSGATAAPQIAFSPAVAELQTELTAAASATSWPNDLVPSFDDVIATNPTAPEISACAGKTFPNLDDCTYGDDSAPNSLVLVGDSISVAYAPAFRQIAEDSGGQWKVTLLGAYGCTFLDVTIDNADKGAVDACPGRKANAIAAINELKPTIVVITNTYVPRGDLNGKNVTADEWGPAMRRLTDQFQSATKHLVFLSPAPDQKNIADCYSPMKSAADCASHVGGDWKRMKDVETALAVEVGGVWIDSSLWNCTVDGVCPAFAGTTPTKFDRVHITPSFAKRQAPALRDALQEKGVM